MKPKGFKGKLVIFDDLEKSILLTHLRVEKAVQINRSKSSCYTLDFRALSYERSLIVARLIRKIRKL